MTAWICAALGWASAIVLAVKLQRTCDAYDAHIRRLRDEVVDD